MSGQTSTIFALSSGGLPSGIAVIRISGRQTRFALETICGMVPPARVAQLLTLRFSEGAVLDRGIAIFFEAPASFTGEDAAELQLHGSKAVVAAVTRELGSMAGFRHAEPGEFTLRAFLNGKIDLTEAEALADLVDAETEYQRRLAVANADGAQRKRYDQWRARLVEARAMVEAEIDFADEGDVPDEVAARIFRDVEALNAEIRAHRGRAGDGEIVRDGFKVALMGAPNSGKSSLLNRLARRDAAIVTPEAGTTRDVIEVVLDLGGARVRLFDTAGLRADAGHVEALGIARAKDVASSADLVLVLDDLATGDRIDVETEGQVLRIGSRCDLAPERVHPFPVSSLTGEGLDLLEERIGALARERAADAIAAEPPTRLRHVRYLDLAIQGLDDALAGDEIELRAEGLRVAGEALGSLTGAIHTEELLGVIFSRFCIGK